MSRYLERILLVLILLLALFLRLYGLGFSLPYTIHPDEPNVVDHAVVTIKTGSWNPHWFIYPSGYHYLQVGVQTLQLLWGIARGVYSSPADLPDSSDIITSAPATYLWGRGTTALLGVLTVFLVYLLGRRLVGPAAGLSGALLLALSPLHVENSHYIATDVPTAALALLSVYLALDVLEKGGLGRGFLAGLVVGLTGAFKYNGVVVLLPLLLAVGMRAARRGEAWPSPLASGPAGEATANQALSGALSRGGRDGGGVAGQVGNRARQNAWPLLLLALVGVLVGYTLACPYTFADLPTFLKDLGYETHIYRFGGVDGVIRIYEVGGRILPPWQAYAHALWAENPPVALAYLGGILLVLVRRRRTELLLLSFVAAYYFFLSSYASVFVRNILPAVPALAALGGIFLAEGVPWLEGWLLASLGRFLAARRGRDEASGASRSAGSATGPPAWYLPVSTVGLTLLLVAVTISPTLGILGADRYMAVPTSQVQARAWLDAHVAPGEKVAGELQTLLFAHAAYHFTEVEYLSNYPLEAFTNQGYAYIVANSETYGPDFARVDTFPDYYLPLLNQLERVADFPGHTKKLPGPRLTIFRVPAGAVRPQKTLDAAAGPGLHLLGLDLGQRQGKGELTYVQRAEAVRAGEVLAITLYLRADATLPEDYIVFVRLRNAEGRVVTTVEPAPCGGACPPSGWTPGQVVSVDADMPLATVLPAGDYRLELQFLRPGSREPLSWAPAGPDEGVLLLAEVQLVTH